MPQINTCFTVRNEMVDGVHVMILLRCMRYEDYSETVQKEIIKYFESEGDYRPLTCKQYVSAIIGQSKST